MAACIEKLACVEGVGRAKRAAGGGCRRAKRASRRRPRLGAEGAVQASFFKNRLENKSAK